MKRSHFGKISLLVIVSLVLLAAVEAVWAVRTYRNMHSSYTQQIESILEEASWQYVVLGDGSYINIGSIDRFWTIIADELRTAGIDTDYRVEVLTTTDSDPVVLMSKGGERLGDAQLSVERTLTPIILRLTVTDPESEILRSMRGMLILQLVSIVILAATFIFLLRTLFRAKSIEQIRRDLTHNITHELKTPIAAAYAATDALLTSDALSSNKRERNEYLNMTLTQLKRLNTMVEEILRSSTERYSAEELRIEECDIGEIVEEVRRSMELKYAGRSVEWSVDIAAHTTLLADRFHLSGIVSALIDNAIKYSPDTARVGVVCHGDDDNIILSIEDSGIGIPRKAQRHIFKKFYRVPTGNRHDSQGYGLGLYYVGGMVRCHGGSIKLRSTEGKGSRFEIRLPRYGK
ncbi:MAG: HAMP domain-containing histidine kinase [Alistipes sp.]|nr:HAMP domain-containing histidine kinase [Alistipes sp.]